LLQIKVHPKVYNELEQARSWYENQAKGLGAEFLDEVEHAINLIRQFPDTWPPYSGGTRRFLSQSYTDMIRIKFRYLLLRIYAENLGIGRTEKFKVCAEELA